MIEGYDISSAQGEITDEHWTKIAAQGIRFVYLECGLGNTPMSSTFDRNVAGARAAGIACGPYHFTYPLPIDGVHQGRDPESQAQAHFEASGGLGVHQGELPPAQDSEWPEVQDWAKWGVTAASIRVWTLRYRAKMESLTGRGLVTYTYPYFAESVGFDTVMGTSRLWLADYSPTPKAPAPWASYTICQYSNGGGRLPNGCPVDQNIIMDETTLTSLLSA